MKRIVILCDGTWNRFDSVTPTNVVRLAQALEPISAQGIVQVPIYIRGVGTGEGPTKLSRTADRLLGGAFGHGLLRNIQEAYRHLVFLYEPGDEIYIFGFSRGAYTARSLTGLIRSTGIVRRDDLHMIPEAVARYRTLDDDRTHPNSDHSHTFRARMSPRVVTSPKEQEWRRKNDHPEAPLLQITYLGVWDSVGALGVPAHIPVLGHLTSRRYRFHDARLSSLVRSARHAVALDERRRSFAPTLWENVDDLNAEAEDSLSLPYREKYFPGDHGSVGGGGDIVDLSNIALRWVMEGAMEAGLEFDANRLEANRSAENPMGPLSNRSQPETGIGDRITRLRPKDREGPKQLSQLHRSVFDRWSAEAKSEGFRPYRPGSLARVETQLVAWFEQQTADGDDPPTRVT